MKEQKHTQKRWIKINKKDAPKSPGHGTSPKKPYLASIEEIFKTYYAYLKSYHPHSLVAVKKSKKHHKFFFGLDKITPKDIIAYQKKRLQKKGEAVQADKAKKETVEKELQHCHSAFTRAINAGIADSNPFEKV